VLASSAQHLGPGIVRLLQHRGIHSDWQSLKPGENLLATPEPHTAVHAALIAGDVSSEPSAAMTAGVGDDGFTLVHPLDNAPVFDDFATATRLEDRLWIATRTETDLARIVPLRGLIEGDRPMAN